MAAKPALIALVNTLVDAAVDTAKALQPGQTPVEKVAAYENLIADAMADVSVISDLPAEVSSLGWQDYLSLASDAMGRFSFSSAHAQAIVAAVLQLLSDAGSSVLVEDVIAVFDAVRGPQPAAPAAPVAAPPVAPAPAAEKA